MKWYNVGNIHPTSDGNVMVINATDERTEFMEMFGTYRTFDVTCTKGNAKGVVGHGLYRPTERNYPTPAYRSWSAMLNRRSIYYGVCDEWLIFQEFAEWYYRQLDRHGDWRSVPFKWMMTNRLIDPDNRENDRVVCCVVPSPVVKLFNNPSSPGRELPLGVHHFGDRYIAFCSMFGKGQKHKGVFDTIEAARNAYWSAKCETVRQTAAHYRQWIPDFLADRLMNFNLETAKIYYPAEFGRLTPSPTHGIFHS